MDVIIYILSKIESRLTMRILGENFFLCKVTFESECLNQLSKSIVGEWILLMKQKVKAGNLKKFYI